MAQASLLCLPTFSAGQPRITARASNEHPELRAISELLGRIRRVRFTPEDFNHCLASVRRHTLSHGIGWPDLLIAATALRLGVPVATLNDKHFRPIRGIRVLRPY